MKSRALHTLVAVSATLVMIAAVFAVRTAPARRSWGNDAAPDRDRPGPVVEAGGRSVSDDESSPGTNARPGRNDIGGAHTLVGRFALADGTPVPRAEVSVHAMHVGRRSASPTIVTSWSCETDRLGQFRLDGLPDGRYRASAQADDVPFGRGEFELPREAPLVILTRAVRRFRVTVADDEGAPIAGARVCETTCSSRRPSGAGPGLRPRP
jgi:hypothetical protein